MERVAAGERRDWRELAGKVGFHFHTQDGLPYWDESAHYRLSLREIEKDLEGPTEEIHEMCMDLVSRAARDEQYLRRLAIPAPFWDFVRSSWLRGDPHLYGRMDLAYDGRGPAKLYELNYDTPTSLYECAVFQWMWLEQCIERGSLPRGADQFNSVQQKLVRAFQFIGSRLDAVLHFASIRDVVEDLATVEYLRDLARQAGIRTQYIAMEDIGAARDGRYTDLNNQVIEAIFKLYPWEFMFDERFASLLPTAGTLWFEPPWKAVLSNKAALALLWELHPNHPNLLPAFVDDSPADTLPPGWVRKPFFSREGANIELATNGGERLRVAGPYSEGPFVRQAFHPLPTFGKFHSVVGSWVIGDQAAGIGIREDDSLITRDSARFVPHAIVD
jgi:glutathionylspermidine synthase